MRGRETPRRFTGCGSYRAYDEARTAARVGAFFFVTFVSFCKEFGMHLELKCVREVLPIHQAQLLSYMKLLDVPVGLIINFYEIRLADGITRRIQPGANR